MAKAAVNQQAKTLALDFQRDNIPVTTLALDPGWIKTRLTRWKGRDDIVEACNGMVDVIERLTLEMSGQFINWKGEPVPWQHINVTCQDRGSSDQGQRPEIDGTPHGTGSPFQFINYSPVFMEGVNPKLADSIQSLFYSQKVVLNQATVIRDYA